MDINNILPWKLRAEIQNMSLLVERAREKFFPASVQNRYSYLKELGYDIENMSCLEVDEAYDRERWRENFL